MGIIPLEEAHTMIKYPEDRSMKHYHPTPAQKIADRRAYVARALLNGANLDEAAIAALAVRFGCSSKIIHFDIVLAKAAFDEQSLEEIVRLKWNGCNKRAELAGVVNNLDWNAFLKLFQDSNGECHYCHKRLSNKAHLIADHVIPLAQGGSNTIDNIVLACSECNTIKGDRLLGDLMPDFSVRRGR